METKPSKLRKVKTVWNTLSGAEAFDREVNEALAEGWYLVKRYTIPGYDAESLIRLVAELQRYDDYDE